MRLDLSSRVRIGVSRTGAVGFSSGIPYNADPRSWSATQAYETNGAGTVTTCTLDVPLRLARGTHEVEEEQQRRWL